MKTVILVMQERFDFSAEITHQRRQGRSRLKLQDLPSSIPACSPKSQLANILGIYGHLGLFLQLLSPGLAEQRVSTGRTS